MIEEHPCDDPRDEFDKHDSALLTESIRDLANFFENRAGPLLRDALRRQDVADIEDQLAWLATACLTVRQEHTLKRTN